MLEPSPYNLDDTLAYETWKVKKLAALTQQSQYTFVSIKNLTKITAAEYQALHKALSRYNWVIYQTDNLPIFDKQQLQQFGTQMGITRLDHNIQAGDDGITALRVISGDRYIPYTNRPIQWHTDGYYNKPAQTIFSMMLHCVSPAASGGDNALIDHEQVYIHLRDLNFDFIKALSAPQAMTIPANIIEGKVIRAAQSGAVFSVSAGGQLHMRYTARLRHIEWAQDNDTQAAVQALRLFLDSDHPAIARKTLTAGEGLLCRNVLHNRSPIADDPQKPRLFYRLRYFDEIL